jgi:hypothetical protein
MELTDKDQQLWDLLEHADAVPSVRHDADFKERLLALTDDGRADQTAGVDWGQFTPVEPNSAAEIEWSLLELADKRPDWRQVTASPSFHSWARRQPVERQRVIYGTDDAGEVLQIIAEYERSRA